MAAPRNVEYYVSRINGYSKNTIRLQPVSQKDPFVAQDVIIFRLPTNAIVDLHTLCVSADFGIVNGDAAANEVAAPRYAQSLIRRLDVTSGGVQVGLGSLGDYGGLYSLLSTNTVSRGKHDELSILEGGHYGNPAIQVGNAYKTVSAGIAPFYSGNSSTLVGADTVALGVIDVPPVLSTTVAIGGTNKFRINITGFLGVLGGQYMRFLDTNLLPDVEIRITLASNAILMNNALGGSATTLATYTIQAPQAQMETIAFGDNTYEQMASALLTTRGPSGRFTPCSDTPPNQSSALQPGCTQWRRPPRWQSNPGGSSCSCA